MIVATVRALKMHGGVAKDDLGKENVDAVRAGCVNLERHLRNVKRFGVPPVVAINRFTLDTEAELNAVREAAAKYGAEAIICSHWADGGAGTEQLASHVVEVIDGGVADFKPLYPDEMPLWDKIKTVATQIYDASDIGADAKVRKQIENLQQNYGHFPVCMAKDPVQLQHGSERQGCAVGARHTGTRGAVVGRGRVRGRDLRGDHDHARSAERAGCEQDRIKCVRGNRGTVLIVAFLGPRFGSI